MKLCDFCERPAEKWSSREIWFYKEQQHLTVCIGYLQQYDLSVVANVDGR